MNSRKIATFYTIYTAVMPLVLSSLATILLYKSEHYLRNTSNLELVGLLLISIVCMGFALLPTSFISLVAGYFWGLWSIPFLVVSYGLATGLGYWLGQKMNIHTLYEYQAQKPKTKKFLENLTENPFQVIVLARLSPVFPFGVSNALFTFLGMPLATLLWAGILGMLPRSLALVYLGSKAKTIADIFSKNSGSWYSSTITWLGILATGLLLALILFKYKKTRKL
jgi:uncharacterized membrane protein YdjX (TVP38/TMEM64 family)